MKTIGIEAFLSWVYRDELPKAASEGHSDGPAMSSMWKALGAASLGTLGSDGRPNAYGVISSTFVVSAPHADALAAHQAVVALDTWLLDVPDGWAPLADLGLSDAEHRDAVSRALARIAISVDGQQRYRQRPGELIRHHAIMRSAPSWEAEAPLGRFITRRGKPQWFRIVKQVIRGVEHEREVEGFDKSAQRPFPDAYRKTFLDPDPALAAVDRAEYEVWDAALRALAETLNASGALAAHRLLPPDRLSRPWEATAPVARIA